MSKTINTYNELLVENQKLEALFEAQKALVKFEISDIRKELNPAFNALEFLKNLSFRNTKNPIMQAGVTMLVDFISKKTEGEDAGFIRSMAVPFLLKNFASNIMADPADHFMGQLVSLFTSDETPEEEEQAENETEETPAPVTE